LSTFWVITEEALPEAASRATAAWPALGLAPTQPAVPAKVRVQASRRRSSFVMNSSK
jgi:hypothetical protein